MVACSDTTNIVTSRVFTTLQSNPRDLWDICSEWWHDQNQSGAQLLVRPPPGRILAITRGQHHNTEQEKFEKFENGKGEKWRWFKAGEVVGWKDPLIPGLDCHPGAGPDLGQSVRLLLLLLLLHSTNTIVKLIEMNIKIARRKTPKPPYWHCLLWLWTAIFCWKDKDISGALWLQWDAEEVKYVTMSHGRSTHRVKNVLLPCRPFPGGQKWKCTFAFAFEWLLQLTVQRASEKRHWRPLSDVLTGYTALVKREQVENDGRRRIFQSIPDGAVLRRVTCK